MRVLYIFLIAFFCLYSVHSCAVQTTFALQNDSFEKQINAVIIQPFILKKVTYDTDVYISPFEFDYLTELKEGGQVDAIQIKRAVSCLFKKNKFSNIDLIIDYNENDAALHFVLNSYWTLKAVKFHGILVGRDAYRQYYLMENGDQFNQEKHELSLKKIVQAFKDQGYFNASVESSLTKDDKYKHVVTHITLKRKSIFTISDLQIMVKKDDETINTDGLEEAIKKKLANLIGASYDKKLLSEQTKVVRHFLESNGYSDSSISLQQKIKRKKKKVELILTVEIFHKKKFNFFGNDSFPSNELLELILMFGRSASLLPPNMISQELERFYRSKGFWDVKIAVQENSDQCSFTIQESNRMSIAAVEFKYAHFFDHEMLRKKKLKSLLKSKFYDEQLLKEGIDNLLSCYLQEGYLDIKVLKQEFVPLDDNHHKLILTLDEGKRWYISDVKIKDFELLQDRGPFIKFKNGMSVPFNMQELQEQKNCIADYFHNQGYTHIQAKPEIARENGNVAITWHIKVGDKAYFGKTILVGSTKLPFEYIAREMKYKQGDIWNKDALKKSFSSLKALEMFEYIHLYPNQQTLDGQKNIMVKVQEDEPFELRLRAGLELQNFTQNYKIAGITYRAGGSFLIKSPFNQADQFVFDADFTRVHREVSAKYKRPWIGDFPIKTIVEGYTNSYCQPGFVGSTQSIYQIIQQGILVGLSREYGCVDAGFTCGFELMKTNIPDRSDRMCNLIDSIARAINFDARLLEQNIPYFQVEPTLIINRVDQQLNPTQGYFSVFSLKGMVPLSRSNIVSYFVKALFEQSFYMPLKSTVFATRFRIGHIFFRTFRSIMPNERFYLGGANSLRGYETDFAGPIGRFFDCDCVERFAPQGGKTMVNINAEWRFPIYKGMGAVIFQDLGALSGCGFTDFKANHILASTGLGIRLGTPLGPLRFDLGWKWRRQPGVDRNFAWFLTFGQAF